MAPRIARPYWFRATGARVPWAAVAKAQYASAAATPWWDKLSHDLPRIDDSRTADLQLRWQCKAELGVPFGPFTVWTRAPKDALKEVDVTIRQRSEGLSLRLPVVAAVIAVQCDVIDPTRAVGLVATYVGGGLREAVGATAVSAPGGGRITLRVRCSGATRVLLVNGTNPTVGILPLQDVLDDPGWKEMERVGLPVDDPWPGTGYDTSQQGLVTAPTDPVSAALERLKRGGPPVGWAPVTGSGRLAPSWRAPDYPTLLKEIQQDLLPRIERLYRPGRTPADQATMADSPTVDPPSVGSKKSSLATTATLAPLSLLALPSSADPFLALATGFGTAYPVVGEQRRGVDVLVTAEYPDTPWKDGPVVMAAFVPYPDQHAATTAPHGLTAARSGLVAPGLRDAPWRESVRVHWDRVPGTAAMGRPTGGVLARFETAGPGVAEPLVERRLAGDLRPLVLVPDDVKGTPGYMRTSMVDADVVIPLGSGGRHVGYPVAVQDVFGVWSPWADAPYDGTEPAPPGPRVVGLRLESQYAGTATCPATLTVEVAVDWPDRTPVSLELHSVFFRTPTASAPVPGGVDPVAVPPSGSGMFRRDLSLPFAGDRMTAPAGVTVVHLDPDGAAEVTPGPDQGQYGRRYRITVPVPVLDFSSTPRWGVQVWVRTPLVVVTDAGWRPEPAHPAVAVVASPVPVMPIPPPAPPGVPLGSTPDAQNRSHVRVHWSVPSGAPLDPDKGIIVWECAETALRQAAGLTQRAPGTTAPGVRLAELWDAYDALTQDGRRSAFRRLLTLPGTAREADVALPPGSTDIHQFTVTTLTATGVESPWPTGGVPHEQLQSVTAPRLRAPGPPRLRSIVGAAGTVTISLSVPSSIEVRQFLLYRTRSVEAALRVETMGPSFASVTAVAPASGSLPDPASGELLYTGSWSGSFDESWDDWQVRAIAVPVDEVPVQAVRGLPSPACDVVVIRVRPDGPPDLAPLVSQEWGAGDDGVLVTTSTSAPARVVPDGEHRLSGSVQPSGAGAEEVAVVALHEVAVGPQASADDGAPPAGSDTGRVVVRGARASGRTPLALWFTRPVATDPVDVVLRLTDPLGRVTEQRLTVPGHVPDEPPSLEILGVTTITGRGTVIRVRSDADVEAVPPTMMTIVATPRVHRPGPVRPGPIRPLPGPFDRFGGGGFPGAGFGAGGRFGEGGLLGPLGPFGRSERLEIALPDIPTRAVPAIGAIQVARSTTESPQEYQVLVRMALPFTVRISLDTSDGLHAEEVTSVPT